MIQKVRNLGIVDFVQIQPQGMRKTTNEGEIFDPTCRIEVNKIEITSDGISGKTPGGELVLDIHHRDHPESRFKPGNAVSIGFTAHYRAIRDWFGAHIGDGTGGENVIIDFSEEVWLEDLGTRLLFENPTGDQAVVLNVNRFATPCEPFTHFVIGSQHERYLRDQFKAALQFLSYGRRGFLLSPNSMQEKAFISPGDRVFVVSE